MPAVRVVWCLPEQRSRRLRPEGCTAEDRAIVRVAGDGGKIRRKKTPIGNHVIIKKNNPPSLGIVCAHVPISGWSNLWALMPGCCRKTLGEFFPCLAAMSIVTDQDFYRAVGRDLARQGRQTDGEVNDAVTGRYHDAYRRCFHDPGYFKNEGHCVPSKH